LDLAPKRKTLPDVFLGEGNGALVEFNLSDFCIDSKAGPDDAMARAYVAGSAYSMTNGTTKRSCGANPPSARNASPMPGRPNDTIRA